MAMRRAHSIEVARAVRRANNRGTKVEYELMNPPSPLFVNGWKGFPRKHVREWPKLGKLSRQFLALIKIRRIRRWLIPRG